MYSLGVIVDNKNHAFLADYLRENCKEISIASIPLSSIIGHPSGNSIPNRVRVAKRIRQWLRKNKNFDGILLFSDYYFGYRTLVQYCRATSRPVFIYQDGFIALEPWPKDFTGLLKRLTYRSLKLIGLGHLMSYLSFHTNPTAVFSWGDFFSRAFKNTTKSNIISVGTIMYAKDFEKTTLESPESNRILYYGTFYRDPEKDLSIKLSAVRHLKKVLDNHLTCDIKLHPLDSNKGVFEEQLQQSSLLGRVHFLGNDFLLHKHIGRYKYILSEFSTETIFASIFCRRIFFVKNEISEKHYRLIKSFLKSERIGDTEYYAIDRTRMEHFQKEYFQNFDIDRFEQAVQAYR